MRGFGVRPVFIGLVLLVVGVPAALARSEGGGVLKLGQINTVDATTTLTGSPPAGAAQLKVVNAAYSGYGVVGQVNSTDRGVPNAGVWGINAGTHWGAGVLGSTDGVGDGVVGTSVEGYGVAASSGDTAIYASGASNTGVLAQGALVGVDAFAASLDGVGVFGHAPPLGGNSYGVWGMGSEAGHFSGNVSVIGNLSVTGTKNFRIDDPLDPANKFLVHAAVESNEVLNVYSGNVTTDGNGLAAVQLPAYFDRINTDFRYQLTVIGTFAQAIIGTEIQDNRFTIRTDKPNVKVSWQVTARRNDAYLRAHPFQAEQAKTGEQRGKYVDPQAYRKPASASIEKKLPALWATPPAPLQPLPPPSGINP
jgi:hypothetical protein